MGHRADPGPPRRPKGRSVPPSGWIGSSVGPSGFEARTLQMNSQSVGPPGRPGGSGRGGQSASSRPSRAPARLSSRTTSQPRGGVRHPNRLLFLPPSCPDFGPHERRLGETASPRHAAERTDGPWNRVGPSSTPSRRAGCTPSSPPPGAPRSERDPLERAVAQRSSAERTKASCNTLVTPGTCRGSPATASRRSPVRAMP